jgi:hypothetical protein
MVCATAGTNRAPFDLPEAESELVAGFMTEYSGFRWAMFFMGEYCAMFLLALLGAILFCGGWNGPVPVATWLGLTPEHGLVTGFIGNFLGMCSFIVKGLLGVIFMMWLRWTLPRLRIDQVMTTCLKYCVPLASIMLVGTMISIFWVRGGVSQLIKRHETPPPANQRSEYSPLPTPPPGLSRWSDDWQLQSRSLDPLAFSTAAARPGRAGPPQLKMRDVWRDGRFSCQSSLHRHKVGGGVCCLGTIASQEGAC